MKLHDVNETERQSTDCSEGAERRENEDAKTEDHGCLS